jgi:hydroxyacylglutathione hydrolase
MPALELFQFPCLSDNFGVLVHDPSTKSTATIDAPDAGAVTEAAKSRGWTLTHILTTHHHDDHTDGNLALKKEFGVRIIGPDRDTRPIPGLDEAVRGGSTFDFCGRRVDVISAPGHTKGHIVYHLPTEKVAFVGDVLFSLGCGRVIEGTMDEMWTSLDTLRKLPGETVFYCGHEYTVANARFALSVEPGNAVLKERAAEAERQRAAGRPTLPATIAAELAANPFLRTESPEIRRTLSMPDASNAKVFAELRERKNRF